MEIKNFIWIVTDIVFVITKAELYTPPKRIIQTSNSHFEPKK